MPSPRSFTILFIVGSTFPFFILVCLNNSWWCFSSSFEDRRRVYLHILSVLSEIRGSSSRPSSRNCFDRENSFHPSGVIQESSQFVYPEAIILGYSFSAFSSRSPNLTGASFKFFSIKFAIYSFSCIKCSQVSSFFL